MHFVGETENNWARNNKNPITTETAESASHSNSHTNSITYLKKNNNDHTYSAAEPVGLRFGGPDPAPLLDGLHERILRRHRWGEGQQKLLLRGGFKSD